MSVTFYLCEKGTLTKRYFKDVYPNFFNTIEAEDQEFGRYPGYQKDETGHYFELIDVEAEAVELQLSNGNGEILMHALSKAEPDLALNCEGKLGVIPTDQFGILMRAAIKLCNSSKLADAYAREPSNIGSWFIDCGLSSEQIRSYGARLMALITLATQRNATIGYS